MSEQCFCPDCIRCGCGMWERHHPLEPDPLLPLKFMQPDAQRMVPDYVGALIRRGVISGALIPGRCARCGGYLSLAAPGGCEAPAEHYSPAPQARPARQRGEYPSDRT